MKQLTLWEADPDAPTPEDEPENPDGEEGEGTVPPDED